VIMRYRDPKTGRFISKKKAMELGLIKEEDSTSSSNTTNTTKTTKTELVWNGWRWVPKK